MKTTLLLIYLFLLKTLLCRDINKLFEKINKDTVQYNSIAAELAWESSLDPGNPDLPDRAANYQRNRILWQQSVCDKLVTLNNDHLLNDTQRRQTYLLCRGPKFTFSEARESSSLYEELQSIYSDAEICIPSSRSISTKNLAETEQTILDYLAISKEIFNTENNFISVAAKVAVKANIDKNNALCLKGEDDLEKLMRFSRNEQVLKWIWLVWRERVGPSMKEPYKQWTELSNRAAIRNGYHDIGASWRDELEIPKLRQLCRRLYEDIRPLYTLLHGVTRFFLRRQYGDVVPERGPIPAHLLGNLWAQSWEPLLDLILQRNINLDESITNLNWTVLHMVKRVEDFYQSLGLPAMTDTFWRESVFARENDNERCHGTAADMFKDGDYRLLYCSGTTAEDFYVLHHEMGHIQYYMAYEHQSGIFRQANTALHETIGDTIMYGVMTPQHLNRLGLINDTVLYEHTLENLKYDDESIEANYDKGINNIKDTNDYDWIEDEYEPNDNQAGVSGDKFETNENRIKKLRDSIFKVTTDDILILKLALNKLPHLPFSLLIDEYRWSYFEGKLDEESLNKVFWEMALALQGIAPPEERGEEYFDVGAKFHVPDNTPYIRYFLSSFLQHQLFENLCKAAVFGRRGVTEDLPSTITMNRCDIYGSKAAGKLLKDFMSRGNSQHWREILEATIGEDHITAAALKRYYRPLYKLLLRLTHAYQIPIGW